MVNKMNDYVIKSTYKSFIVVSILSALIATVGMMIDNIVVGRYLGTECLAAMGIVSPISMILSAIGNISSSGGATMAARELGKGNKEKMRSVFTISMGYTIVTGAVMMLAIFFFAPQIATLLGAKGSLMDPTVAYLRGIAVGSIPTIMMPNFLGFVKLDGSNRLPLTVIGAMSVVDVVLDLLVAIVFKQGMFWMAMATSIGYFVAVAICFTHFTKDYNTLKFIKPLEAWNELKEMVSTGAATALSRVCDTLKMIIFNNMMVIVAGAGAVAALNVRQQVYNLVGSLIMGAGQALMPMAALFFGEEDENSLKTGIKVSIKIGLEISIVAAIILLFIPSVFVNALGVKEPEIVSMAEYGIRIFAISMPIRLIVVLWNNYYQSTRRNILAIVISILQAFGFTVLAAVIMFKPLQANGIFLSFLVGEVLTLIFIYVYAGIKNKKFSFAIDKCMLLPEGFGKGVIRRWDVSIGNSINEVIALSEKIQVRAKEENFEHKSLNVIALAIEEMAGNVIKHAFNEGEKRWLDILIIQKEDGFILRLRDNGKMFDPLKYLHEHENDDNLEHMGINLIKNLADDVSYSRTIGLNNLILTVNNK